MIQSEMCCNAAINTKKTDIAPWRVDKEHFTVLIYNDLSLPSGYIAIPLYHIVCRLYSDISTKEFRQLPKSQLERLVTLKIPGKKCVWAWRKL